LRLLDKTPKSIQGGFRSSILSNDYERIGILAVET